jgi:serpin B
MAELANSSATLGVLEIPKFTAVTPPASLKSVLMGMGIRSAFAGEPGGGFSRLSKSAQVVVSDIVHTAAVEVSEEGTTASAASAVTVISKALPRGNAPDMIVNRPFILAIRNSRTGAVLFLGRVDDPSMVG